MLQKSENKEVGERAWKYFCCCEEIVVKQKANESRKRARTLPDETEGHHRRVRVCDTVKEFHLAIAGTPFNLNCGDHAYFNGITNKAVTGGFKYEWAEKWGVEPKKLNLRDHMTADSLALATSLQILTKSALENDPSANPREVHERNCATMAEMAKGHHSKSVTREKAFKLQESREFLNTNKATALENRRKTELLPPPPPPDGQITRFFKKKSEV